MKDNTEWQMEFTSWKDIKPLVKQWNNTLYNIIETINPPDTMKLISAEYHYGVSILDNGLVTICDNKGFACPINHPRFPKEFKNHLSYSPIPLALLLDKSNEVSINMSSRVVPLNVLHPGEFFGLFEVLSVMTNSNPLAIWNMCAGARSAVMLPRIADSICHRRLRNELGINVDAPKDPSEHSEIFKQINLRQPPDKQWKSRVIFFTDTWIQEIQNNSHWIFFKNYLFTLAWTFKQLFVGERAINILWEALASAITKRRLRPRTYLVDTVKHLIYVGLGGFPGFKIADNESMLPNRIIQDAYLNIYLLKDYAPLIAHPHNLSGSADTYVYYFLTYPTLLGGFPNDRGTPSILMDVRDIKTIIQTLEQKLPNTIHPSIYEQVKNIQFRFYHLENDKFGEITNSSLLPTEDPAIGRLCQTFEGRHFPSTSMLMPGCIQVARNDDGHDK